MKKGRVTVRDVARAAQVTPQTVSRAIRNAPEISAETRERVLKIAADLNYVKNSTASSLRYGNSRVIVIIYDHLVNVYFSIMIDYLQACFKERNYSILMLSVIEHRLNASAYEFAVSHDAAGIVSFLEPDDEIASMLEGFGIPVLLFGRRTEMRSVDYIRTDDVKGGRLAARRLMERGCKRFLYLSIEMSASCAYDRFRGFAEELSAAGHEAVAMEMFGDWEDRFLALFSDSSTPLDGVFCFSDMLAFEVLFLLQKNGISGVRVVGFDNVQEEVRIPNRLVSVGTDKRAMAERAAGVLVSRIEKGNVARVTETFDVFLREGRSG